MSLTTKTVLLVALFLLLVGCGEKTLTEQEYIEKAKISLNEGDYRTSVIHLKNSLVNYPRSAESRFLLGDIYVRAGDGGGGEKELNRALELGVAEEAVLEKLADALLIQGKADGVIKRFELKDSDSSIILGQKLIALGDAYFQRRQIEDAEGSYGKALSIPTAKIRAQLGLARVNIVKRENDAAMKLLENVMKHEQKNPRAWLTRADVYKAAGNAVEVLLSFENAALNTTSAQDYFYFIAMQGQVELHLQQGKTQQASQVLSKLAASFRNNALPNAPVMNHLRAVLAFQEKRYQESAALAEKVLEVVPDQYGAILLLGVINAQGARYEQAEGYFLRFLLVAPNHLVARKMLAFVQLNRNEARLAVETLKPLESINKLDAETLALVASASLLAGDANKGADYFEKALLKKPDSIALRSGLARSYVGMGEYEKALKELGEVRGSSSDKSRASLAIVETQIKAKNYVAVLKELNKLEQANADEPLYVSLKGTVYLLKNEIDTAKKAFEKALQIKAGFPPAARSLAILAIKEQDESRAEMYYKQVLKANPEHIATLYDYAQLKIRANAFSDAEKLIKQASDLDKNKVRNAVLLARVYLKKQKPAKALAELRLVEFDGLDSSAIYAEQGNAQMMLGEYINALDSYQKLAKIEALSEVAHYLVYTAQLALKNKKAALSALNKALQINAEYVPALIAKVNVLFSEKQLDAATKHIQKLEKLVPGNVNVALLSGELAMRQGRIAEVINLYESLYEKLPATVVVQKLSQAYWAKGDKDQALSVLLEASNRSANNSQLQYILATAYDGLGKKSEAISAYKKAVQLNDRHVLALNNLAWLLKETDLKQALIYAKKALELAPKNKSVVDTVNQLRAM